MFNAAGSVKALTQIEVRDGIPDVRVHFNLDENYSKFPRGSKILDAASCGTSAWTRTTRVIIELADRTAKSYFLECAIADMNKSMMDGEFAAMAEISPETQVFWLPAARFHILAPLSCFCRYPSCLFSRFIRFTLVCSPLLLHNE